MHFEEKKLKVIVQGTISLVLGAETENGYQNKKKWDDVSYFLVFYFNHTFQVNKNYIMVGWGLLFVFHLLI